MKADWETEMLDMLFKWALISVAAVLATLIILELIL